MDYENAMKRAVAFTEEKIQNFLPAEDGFQKTVISAMNYTMLSGGKRLRPILMAETYKLFATPWGDEKTVSGLVPENPVLHRFMTGIELIHNYSLVHDDLPEMDNDEFRRGKKATHAVYGQAMGILAGDALLNYAFEIMAGAFDADCVCEACMLLGRTNEAEYMKRIAQAMVVISHKSGVFGMIGGQTCDVEDEGKNISKEELDFIQENKTASLIEAAMMTGAILGGASDEEVTRLEAAGSGIGRAFQIRDDILDVTGDEAVLGKPVGSDASKKKVTYVTLEGIEKAEADIKALSDDALMIINSFANTNEFLSEIVTRLISRES